MRRIRLRIHKGRVVEPAELPDEGEGWLTVSEDPREATAPDSNERGQLLARTNQAYAALRADPEAWQEELRERARWEGTLADGLDAGERDA